MFHIKRVLWALRKARIPVSNKGLVLDVGSGGTPYSRSDVLLDRLTGAEHRCGAPMMLDRPAVFGDAAKMPFKDKAFDFVIASHILEHMSDPVEFLKELARVGKAGYIETPNAVFERLCPYDIHCLEIAVVNNVLHIHKKKKPVEDDFLGKLGMLKDDQKWKSFMHEMPDMFHVRYFWSNTINYKIYNAETDCSWIEGINDESEHGDVKQNYMDDRPGWRGIGLKVLAAYHTYLRRGRLKKFDIKSILACPECKGYLEENKGLLYCVYCNYSYTSMPNPDFTCAVHADGDSVAD